MGRAGNMLFECAATIGSALNYNADYCFPDWQYKSDFNIPLSKFKNLNRIDFKYSEPYFHYKKIEVPSVPSIDLVGYFQSAKYWTGHNSIIKNLLTPKNLPEKQDKTAIHVRRGDYLKFSDCHPVLPMEYYLKAMQMVKSEKYLIFSDDIEWCKNNFIGSQFEFSDGKSEIEDLKLMISCSNQIIANSSFSWWAAYLNDNLNKTIVAPKVWFGPGLSQHDTKDLLPSDWIKL